MYDLCRIHSCYRKIQIATLLMSTNLRTEAYKNKNIVVQNDVKYAIKYQIIFKKTKEGQEVIQEV